MALTLGTFSQLADGSFTGTLRTLNATAALVIVPVDKTSENAPDHRVYAGNGQRYEVGAGAIYEIARILAGFHENLRDEPLLTFNPGAIVGGTTASFDSDATRGVAFGKVNVVAQSAIVEGDIRAISPEQVERTERRMLAIVADSLPHTSAEIVFFEGYPPMAPTARNTALLQLYSSISEAVGAGPLVANDPLQRGAGDISFVAPVVPAALDGLGGFGGGAHTEEEWIDLESMRQAIRRAAILIYRLTREDGPAGEILAR